ncbi:MAG: AsmA family protein, partial [bacterium]
AGASNLGAAGGSGPPPSGPGTAAPSGGSSILSVGQIGAVTVTGAEISFGPSLRVTGLHGTMNAVDLRAPDWTKQLLITASLRGVTVTAAQLAAPLHVSAGELRIKSTGAYATFSAAMADVQANGTMLVSKYNPLTVRFSLAVPQLNVDALSRLAAGGRGVSAPARGQARPEPKRLLASGTVKIGRLVARPLTLSSVNGTLRVYTTAVEIAAFSLAAYGGSASGSAVVNHATAGIPATVTARIRGVNLSQLLGAFGSGAGRITGSLQANLRLSAALGRDLKRTVLGTGSFVVGNGSFPGMEMQVALAKLARAFQVDVAGGTTKFRRFSGNLRIGGGRIAGSNLTLDAVGFVSTAQGSVGFDGSLDFRGTGHLIRRAGSAPQSGNVLQRIGRSITGTVARGLQGVNVPFTLRGTLGDPRFTLAGDVVVTEEPIRRPEPRESPAD